MSESKYCRICLDSDARMLPISGSEVQDVYEKLTNKKVQEDGTLYYACFICHRHLQNSRQLVVMSQKWDELSKELLISEVQVPVSYAIRMTYGLVHSLSKSTTEALQIPDRKTKTEQSDPGGSHVLKDEWQSESGADAVVGKVEPDDEGALTDLEMDEKHIPDQDEDRSMVRGTKKKTFGILTNIYENNSSPILSNEEGKQELVAIGNNIFICNDCGKICYTKSLLVKHISGHTSTIIKPRKIVKLQKSVVKLTGKKNLRNGHIYTRNKKFKCLYCSASFAKNCQLIKHTRSHTGEKPFKCAYCDRAYGEKFDLKRHIRTHTGERPFKCKFCELTFIQNCDLTRHTRTHTGEKPFKCQHCDYKCTIKRNLNEHIRTHTGEKPFKCEYCNFSCAHRSSFKKHTRTHTGEKPLKCQYCDYRCAVKKNLNAHILVHTGEKPFKCQYCDYRCAEKTNLKNHTRIHTGEKPYKCPYCDYICARSAYLKLHIRTHTGEKPYKCQRCDYSAATHFAFKVHNRTHTGERPFKCEQCDYASRDKYCLDSHRLRVHIGRVTFECEICHKRLKSSRGFKIHLKGHMTEYCSTVYND